ncbi:TRAP transporter large permease [Texcoconibacillus texcoconensis]|uniref:C4-dicarboxylate transporter DctM subunit n=1 Tax=Texcoconibacillus texcoconensis TaxID=1095777 RepID=A0A840QR61_9BACI|nr:TRAP transporter large permease [Texcoconibacillus texcoconensis]MBB5173840.1 C4-dicarboxylate transporter DctM subunit [Texcoconibacillus texcoconensis]
MTEAILFISFAVLLLLSVPVGIALGVSTLITVLYAGTLPVEFLAQALITSVDSFPLMAVPFFILAGEIMGRGGITDRLFGVANSLVGNKTGGFAIATIITCLFFAAISGSAPATVAAIGGIMIPAMVRMGYDKRFATATVAAAGSLGVMIPPSIPMVIYGVTGSTSVGDLFVAGIIPGFIVAGGLIVYAYFHSKKMGYKASNEKFSMKEFGKTSWDAKWALLIPIIILGGIYGGIFTPTEAAVIAVVYGLFISVVVHRQLPIKELPNVIASGALTTATVLIIVGSATAFGQLLTREQIPSKVADAMMSISESPIVIILLITLLLLIVGCFMDTLAAIIILTPLLLPIAVEIGYDPVHFGIIMVVNLAIGFITPPLGVNLFVGSGISGLSIEAISRAIIPFFIAMLVTLFIIIFIPELSTFLPSFRG